MLKTIAIVTGLLLAAVALLAVRIIVKKDGQFPPMHISDSKPMRERGIGCLRPKQVFCMPVQSQDRQGRRQKKGKIDVEKC